ncbi:MAG: dihydroorotate dehydrogenase-like protein, partial [Thermoanaerobaculia bacterium]|nr:dihydroorotate dehydrogenase-like protein [Thermoanaerobaculia bacterium]
QMIGEAKQALSVPVIPSLNGYTPGGWTQIARQMEEAGADAIELNVYYLATDAAVTGAEVERRYLELVADVRREVSVPLAVKMAPYFSSPAHMAQGLVASGADGLVLFNRFMQPDIDLDTLEMSSEVVLSRSWESRLPLRWIAILKGRVEASLAATTGAHTAEDVLKLVLVGADAVAVASVLLARGVEEVATILAGVGRWLEENEYASLEQAKGSMSLINCPDPEQLERTQYMRLLRGYSGKAI